MSNVANRFCSMQIIIKWYNICRDGQVNLSVKEEFVVVLVRAHDHRKHMKWEKFPQHVERDAAGE